MNRKRIKYLITVLTMAAALLCSWTPVYANTDGSELQVMQPQQLEIQLGSAWTGVEFRLKTDAGLYPGTVTVGDDGVLRLEIGGSSFYRLSCLNSATPVPAPEHEAQSPASMDEVTPAQEELPPIPQPQETSTPASVPEEESAEQQGARLTVLGMVLALSVIHLVWIGTVLHRQKRKRGFPDDAV